MNVLEGTIESREFQGDSIVLRVRTAEEVLQVKAAPSKRLDVRTPVYLLISPENCRAVAV